MIAGHVPFERAPTLGLEVLKHRVIARVRPGREFVDEEDLEFVRIITRQVREALARQIAVQFVIIQALTNDHRVNVIGYDGRGRV